MFGEAAIKLLKMMGHSGTVPSAILPEDIPDAIQRLQSGLAAAQAPADAAESESDDDQDEPRVSIGQRAFPLVELLKHAAKADCSVLWERV